MYYDYFFLFLILFGFFPKSLTYLTEINFVCPHCSSNTRCRLQEMVISEVNTFIVGAINGLPTSRPFQYNNDFRLQSLIEKCRVCLADMRCIRFMENRFCLRFYRKAFVYLVRIYGPFSRYFALRGCFAQENVSDFMVVLYAC